jgi:hypothetical protein
MKIKVSMLERMVGSGRQTDPSANDVEADGRAEVEWVLVDGIDLGKHVQHLHHCTPLPPLLIREHKRAVRTSQAAVESDGRQAPPHCCRKYTSASKNSVHTVLPGAGAPESVTNG